MSPKAPFRSYKSMDDRDWPICCSLLDAESIGFGPKRLRCSVPPLSANMVEQAVTCSCVRQSPGHRACRVQLTSLFDLYLGAVLSLELNLGVKVVACWRGDQAIWAPRST